jgi:RAT1-interacting protein
MEEQVTEQKKKHESEASDRQKLMSYWGYKFETLSTISTPPKQVNEQELEERLVASANTNEQYCVVVKTKLGNHSLIMGAEVDCCLGEY